eukprot:TRINITY_DN781_c0_g1_i1.p1 TRINITY_DN781_c0_g1~~TRINITY_DN781_c0_g1_i1.p1  ORF type:complete len:154 (-),score=48.89 TRINITY_DN781_c0_g1_i1:172-576(-)
MMIAVVALCVVVALASADEAFENFVSAVPTVDLSGNFVRQPAGTFGSEMSCDQAGKLLSCYYEPKHVFSFNATMYDTAPSGAQGGMGIGQIFQSQKPTDKVPVAVLADRNHLFLTYGPGSSYAGGTVDFYRKFC